jgi:hypothetical protein
LQVVNRGEGTIAGGGIPAAPSPEPQELTVRLRLDGTMNSLARALLPALTLEVLDNDGQLIASSTKEEAFA